MAFQILFPLRHFLYPGNVAWTQEGHRFAWRMKLRDTEGRAVFYVNDEKNNKSWKIRNTDYLTKRQADKISCRPDMILQFAYYLEDIWVKQKNYSPEDISVKVFVKCSLNGRRGAILINPRVDLTEIERNLRSADWILPLEEPLKKY